MSDGVSRPNFYFKTLPKNCVDPNDSDRSGYFRGMYALDCGLFLYGSRLLPRWRWVGLDQYERLWETDRWMISINNLILYGVLMMLFSLALGFLLAALLDQKIRGENVFRTIFSIHMPLVLL